MERRLILTRHAKSSWKSDAPTDHERPLNGRGRRNAPVVGEHLDEIGWRPDAVYSSDARRARETWRYMEEGFGGVDIELVISPELYEGGLDEIMDIAGGWSPACVTVMVIGHNPGWQEALYQLTGRDERMTTCNAALLRGRGRDWSDALEGDWTLEAVIRPKELEKG